ncbi:MAG: hypothetical protein WA802_16405 [Terracidiphilus sp.]
MKRKLDEEMRPFRQAGRVLSPINGLLRATRTVLRIPVAEIAANAEINRSVLFDLERRELKGAITLRSLSRMAEAMGCKLVYGIVPRYGKTLEQLMEAREWRKALDGEQ